MTALAIGPASGRRRSRRGDGGVLDHHRDRDLRVVGRGERDEPGVRRPRRRRTLRGAGLAGDLDARDRGRRCRCRWRRPRPSCRSGRRRCRRRSPGSSSSGRSSPACRGRASGSRRRGRASSPRRRWRCRPRPSPSAAACPATSNWPMPVSAVCGASSVLGEAAGRLAGQVLEVVLVEAERLGLVAQLVGAELVGQRERTWCCRSSPAPGSAVIRSAPQSRPLVVDQPSGRSAAACTSAPPGTCESAS